MNRCLIDIDHLMVNVADLDMCRAQYSKLGFYVRKGVRQNAPMGGAEAGGNGGATGIFFPGLNSAAANYLELAHYDPQYAEPFMKKIMGVDEGGVMIVNATEDAEKLHVQWAAQGMGLLPLKNIVFPASAQAEGQTMKLILPEPHANYINVNAVQYASLDGYRNPELFQHRNTAYAWDQVTIIVPDGDLAKSCDYFEKVYGAPPIETTVSSAIISCRKISLRVLEHSAAFGLTHYFMPPGRRQPPFIAGVRILVQDIEAVTSRLADGNLHYSVSPHGSIFTPADHASGLILEFVEGPKIQKR